MGESKTCIYHMGERGHDIDDCLVLKNKVQNLIDKGLLNFIKPKSNVHQIPLPKHQGVNMIHDDNNDDDYEAWKECRQRADRRFVEEALTDGETVVPLGEDNGGHSFMVKFRPPTWSRDPNLVVTFDGWGGLDDLEESGAGISNDATMPEMGLEAEFDDKLEISFEVPLKENINEGDDEYGSDTEEVGKDVNDILEETDEIGNILKGENSDDCVAMITPFVIQLQDGGKPDNQDSTLKPLTIVLTDGMTELALEKKEKVQPLSLSYLLKSRSVTPSLTSKSAPMINLVIP